MGYFVLRHHLDLIGFAVLAIAVVAALDQWVRRTTGRTARFCPSSWAGLLALVIGGVIGADVAGQWIDHRLRTMIGGLAPTYADQMSRLGHDRVAPDTPPDDPTYLALVDAEVRWQRLNPFVADIYTFGRRPDGTIVLLVDAETDYDRNGRYEGEREQRTPIGEPYAADSDTINRAFAGAAVFTDRPVDDRWGTWVSMYVPMRSADGRVTAVLGVDYPADQWVGSILVHRGAMLGLAGTLAATLAGAIAVTKVTRAEARRREAAHRRAATHDGLTGLPNRLLFRERLDAAVAAARRDPAARSAVLFLDCDGFKAVNDTLGHAGGDELLRQVARRLTATLRATDEVARAAPTDDCAPACSPAIDGPIAARLGGDEFCVLLTGLRDDADAAAVAERVLGELARPYDVNGRQARVTASVGVALTSAGHATADDVLRAADDAMYRAKRAGKARYAMAA